MLNPAISGPPPLLSITIPLFVKVAASPLLALLMIRVALPPMATSQALSGLTCRHSPLTALGTGATWELPHPLEDSVAKQIQGPLPVRSKSIPLRPYLSPSLIPLVVPTPAIPRPHLHLRKILPFVLTAILFPTGSLLSTPIALSYPTIVFRLTK